MQMIDGYLPPSHWAVIPCVMAQMHATQYKQLATSTQSMFMISVKELPRHYATNAADRVKIDQT